MTSAKKRVIEFTTVETCHSTSSWIKENHRSLPLRYTLRAISQTSGRGRFNRSWESSTGDDLTFSTFVPVSKRLQNELIHTPQITALAIHSVLKKHGITSEIKWPNDILVDRKKLAGILVEGVHHDGNQLLVIGIGINVNSSPSQFENTPATSLFNETSRKFDIDALWKEITEMLYTLLDNLEKDGFQPFLSTLESALAFQNEIKDVIINEKKETVQIIGLDSSGALTVRNIETGVTRSIISGEISFHI